MISVRFPTQFHQGKEGKNKFQFCSSQSLGQVTKIRQGQVQVIEEHKWVPGLSKLINIVYESKGGGRE